MGLPQPENMSKYDIRYYFQKWPKIDELSVFYKLFDMTHNVAKYFKNILPRATNLVEHGIELFGCHWKTVRLQHSPELSFCNAVE